MDDRAVDKRGQNATAAGIDRKYGKGHSDDVPRGIICMVIATILFSGASAASKWLVGAYPVGEVLCLRSFASLIAGAAIILPVSGPLGFCDASATRPLGARTFAIDLAVLPFDGIQSRQQAAYVWDLPRLITRAGENYRR